MTKNSLPMAVAAVLFDMDNTLVSSEHIWFEAAAEFWIQKGADPTGKGILGGTIGDLVAEFLAEHPAADPIAVEKGLSEIILRRLAEGVDPMPGAVELLNRLSGVVPCTIASNSPSEVVAQVIAGLGWANRFTAALGTEDVVNPKPAPDLYLEAARRCQADIKDCVIFEDSPMGMEAALASGATVVGVGEAADGKGHFSVPSLLDPLVKNWSPQRLVQDD